MKFKFIHVIYVFFLLLEMNRKKKIFQIIRYACPTAIATKDNSFVPWLMNVIVGGMAERNVRRFLDRFCKWIRIIIWYQKGNIAFIVYSNIFNKKKESFDWNNKAHLQRFFLFLVFRTRARALLHNCILYWSNLCQSVFFCSFPAAFTWIICWRKTYNQHTHKQT